MMCREKLCSKPMDNEHLMTAYRWMLNVCIGEGEIVGTIPFPENQSQGDRSDDVQGAGTAQYCTDDQKTDTFCM